MTTPPANAIRVATAVAADIAHGAEWPDAIDRAARDLRISRAAISHAVHTVAAYLHDPYLESLTDSVRDSV